METKISHAAILALHSANDRGQIRIPCGTACEIEALFKELSSLEKAGYLARTKGKQLFRPFHLTAKGEMLRRMLPKAERALAA